MASLRPNTGVHRSESVPELEVQLTIYMTAVTHSKGSRETISLATPVFGPSWGRTAEVRPHGHERGHSPLLHFRMKGSRTMTSAIAVVHVIGFIAAAGVGRSRAGISQRGRLSADLVFGSLPWSLVQMASMVTWPVVLCVWPARGRPKSPWKAVTTNDGSLRVRRKAHAEIR